MNANKEETKSSTLTPDQRARKRLADRKFRKSSREKTKTYISHLEKLVEASRAPSNDPEKVQRLMQQADENYNDSQQLRSTLTNIAELAQSSLRNYNERANRSPVNPTSVATTLDEVNGQEKNFRSPTNNNDKEPIRTAEHHMDKDQFAWGSYSTDLDELLEAVEPFQQKGGEFATLVSVPHNPEQIEPNFANTTDPCLLITNMTLPQDPYFLHAGYSHKSALAKTFEPLAPAILQSSTMNDSQSIWNSMGNITYTALNSSRDSGPLLSGQLQKAHDENVMITAVMHGWHSVLEKDLLDPTWQAIRRMDEQVFRTYGAADRLAMLYVSRLQLLVGCCLI
ncbi:uncharacterized protein N7479_010367 [Penicillium vulpinum]|uniref:Uncharacterized protein n=1 Tax=Penicillium vulpinum TaxID=29845 RepID=A0A1V6S951_9EURO|nr:uncharacterized protein N7479_010367 [Penicillium vulpinum]KAJ5951954.1 hypothetical protein N7479_010367 [Penicillium vulpinum]OQE10259.1 hypothetical protein PENVUL_c004G01659 [Penicillium vulpinum]